MKILVTGGTGFVGSHLTNHLVGEGHEVFVTGTRTENSVPGATLLECGLSGLLTDRLKNLDLVFHQAANNDTTCDDGEEMMWANYHSPKNLFRLLASAGCQRFVYASSTAVYGDIPAPYVEKTSEPNPLNVYALSKLRFEQWIDNEFVVQFPASVVGLRYCNVYGPGECHKGHRASMIRQLAVQLIKKTKPKLFHDGNQRRDWIYVKDVVAANLRAAVWTENISPEVGRHLLVNCGFGQAETFNNIVSNLLSAIDGPFVLYPEWPVQYVANPKPDSYQNFTECDMKKAGEELGFFPSYDIQTALQEYVPYLKKKYD